MPFCPNCGTQASGRFCPNCGSSIGEPAANTASAGGSTADSTYIPPVSAAPGISSNVASMLCYIPFFIGLICGIVFLVASPYNQNKTVRFNAFQSIFLHIALVIFWIVFTVVIAAFTIMAHILGVAITPLIWLCILALFIYMMIKSFNNQTVKLPVIGDLAQKQA